MRAPQRMLVILLLLGAVVVIASPVAAQATIATITGVETCVPSAPGNWTFPDGNIHVRGMMLVCTDVSSDPRGTGTNIVELNANWDSSELGPMWGTFRFTTVEGGVWEGPWEGMVTTSGSRVNAQGNGKGIYEGLKLSMDLVNGTWQARILDPLGD